MELQTFGSKKWYIPDASIGAGETDAIEEWITILNPGDVDAAVHVTFYFEERSAIEGVVWVVKARSSRKVGLHNPSQFGGAKIPRHLPYGIELSSDEPVIVQYTRSDMRQGYVSSMTTIPYFL